MPTGQPLEKIQRDVDRDYIRSRTGARAGVRGALSAESLLRMRAMFWLRCVPASSPRLWRTKPQFHKVESADVFGHPQKRPKMFPAYLYARVSADDQQILAMKSRAMREYAVRRGCAIAVQVCKAVN